jgi:catechol 2,3-dioxygenase-like lactoylglutathione lyase family enzyme
MIKQLDHCNIRTFKIDETVQFYCELLGLRDGMFPGPRGMGAWLYDTTDRPVLHLIAIDPGNPDEALDRIRERLDGLGAPLEADRLTGGGAIDHIAFECADYDDQVERIRGRGLPFRESHVPSIALRQIFVNDPNGVTVELNFR